MTGLSQPDGPSDDHLVTCGHCGAAVWDYPTPEGKHVALDNAPGPYIVHRRKAYKRPGAHGYRGHWDHCKRLAASPLTGEVNADGFLWS
jgi:hypothetical protein